MSDPCKRSTHHKDCSVILTIPISIRSFIRCQWVPTAWHGGMLQGVKSGSDPLK